MSTTKSGRKSVYPHSATEQSGMTLREHYAGLAMQGIVAHYGVGDEVDDERMASMALRQADALLEALER